MYHVDLPFQPNMFNVFNVNEVCNALLCFRVFLMLYLGFCPIPICIIFLLYSSDTTL